MKPCIAHIHKRLNEANLSFAQKPVVIGGMAMEYYGMRKSGQDIDLLISDGDYHAMEPRYQDRRKDLYGDLGFVIEEFEIWRSIALLDYEFFLKDALEEGNVLVVSIDRLLWMRVCAMEVEKYRKDLELMKNYYYEHYTNQAFLAEAKTHEKSYTMHKGTVLGGNYEDE